MHGRPPRPSCMRASTPLLSALSSFSSPLPHPHLAAIVIALTLKPAHLHTVAPPCMHPAPRSHLSFCRPSSSALITITLPRSRPHDRITHEPPLCHASRPHGRITLTEPPSSTRDRPSPSPSRPRGRAPPSAMHACMQVLPQALSSPYKSSRPPPPETDLRPHQAALMAASLLPSRLPLPETDLRPHQAVLVVVLLPPPCMPACKYFLKHSLRPTSRVALLHPRPTTHAYLTAALVAVPLSTKPPLGPPRGLSSWLARDNTTALPLPPTPSNVSPMQFLPPPACFFSFSPR